MDKKKLIEIEDNIPDYIFDDVWVDANEEDIKDLLRIEYPNVEYTSEDVKDIMDTINDTLKEIRLAERETEISDLKDAIGDVIANSSEHLSNNEIGILLVSLASEYFDEYQL